MNVTTTTETGTNKKSEFVFRRLADSFDQFTGDIWASIPTWLLALVVLVIAARVVYRYANPAARAPGAKDMGVKVLSIATWVAVGALVAWVLVAFYNRDTEQAKRTSEAAVTLGSGNTVKWFSFTIGLFVLGSVFVVLMYVKDTKTVRWFWAAPLALLRITVYAILCVVFLLPAMQTWEETNKQSRVVILLDITPSVTSVTDETGGGPGRTARTRMDILIEFLTDENVAFLKKLLEKNPVAIYAFGTRIDESPSVLAQGGTGWSKAEWEAFARYDLKPHVLVGISDTGKEELKKLDLWEGNKTGDVRWGDMIVAKREDADLKKAFGLSADADAVQLRTNLDRLQKRVEVARTIMLGTNVADSITAAVNRESANMVQGIIVFSDGRSNLGSDSGYLELRERASREKIPIFTVGVGEDRQTAALSITEVQAPDSAPIDEAWKIIVEADGINMANKEVEVELHLFKPGSDMKLVDGDGRPRSDHILIEKLIFAPGDPPHGQAEFVIDPAKLPEKLTLESTDAAIKKRVLLEGKWGAIAVIKKQSEEAFKDAFHVRARPDINVVQQKLRILLVAGAPSREFAFLRTLLVREVLDKRASLATYIQNDAGKTGKLTPEQDEVILGRFPDRFDLTNKKIDPLEKPYNLNEYDVVLAFDPDWSELSQQQAADLGRWVREGGGGFIYVAGPINTFQLSRVENPGGKLLPLLDVLPVVPADIVAQRIKPIPKIPRRLYLHPERILGSDLLKLDDKVPDDSKAGWEQFFTDRDKYVFDNDRQKELYPHRGFFSSYPVQSVKPGSAVLAEFVDVGDNGEASLLPWIVTNNPSAAYRTVFLASGELYKLRVFEPDTGTGREFFERFWVKMIKYTGAKRNIKAPRGRVLVGKEGVSGSPLRVQARILSETAKPYEPGRIDPKFKIIQESPGGEKREFGPFDLSAKQTAGGAFDGYYAGQVLLDARQFPHGDFVYRVVVDVPESPGETLTGEFRIRKSDPEMDNTKPDYPAMLRMASEFDKDFQSRLTDKVKAELGTKLPKEAGVPKLAFKITEKDLLASIPECMRTKVQNTQNRGPVNDLWDKGVTIKELDTVSPPSSGTYSWWLGQRISLVLLLVVSLLSLEWLVRKLLRLA